MSLSVIATCLLIVVARITDVSLDTVRTVSVVQGRRTFSAVLGFVEALIYISVIAKVLTNLHHPVYAVAYASGFALGTYLGIVIEQRLAFGQQLAALVTRKGPLVAGALELAGHRVAQVQGQAADGGVTILYVEVPRRRTHALLRQAGAVDDACFCVVQDLRLVGRMPRSAPSEGVDHARA